MVRIVLKITFLKLRYPKGLTGRVPLCPIMALGQGYHATVKFEYSVACPGISKPTAKAVSFLFLFPSFQNVYKMMES